MPQRLAGRLKQTTLTTLTRLEARSWIATSALGVLHQEAMVVQVSAKGIENDARKVKQAISEQYGRDIAGQAGSVMGRKAVTSRK